MSSAPAFPWQHAHPREAEVKDLAASGLGWEDIKVRLNLPEKDWNWVRSIVMSTRAEYRGWK